MKGLLVMLVLFSPFCVGAATRSSADDVTGRDVDALKALLHKTCVSSGAKRNAPVWKISIACDCALEVLNDNLDFKAWQHAYYEATGKTGNIIDSIRRDYAPQMKACVAREKKLRPQPAE